MKKTVIVLMGFIAVAMCFAACSSDDDNGSTPPEDAENEETTDSVQTGTELVVDSAEVWSERDGNRIFGMMYYNSVASKKQPAVILSHSSSLTHEAMSGYALAVLPTGDEEDAVGTSPEVPEVVEQGHLVAENVVKPRPTARGKLRGVDNRKSFPFEDFFCMSKSGQVGFPPQPTNFSAQIANLLSSHIASS